MLRRCTKEVIDIRKGFLGCNAHLIDKTLYIIIDVVQAKEQILDPQALSKRLRSLEGDYRAKIGLINRTERELSKLKAGYLRGNFF